jgi:tRNA (mo5U34)-methyltransferase
VDRSGRIHQDDPSASNIRFSVADASDFTSSKGSEYDIVIFKGIFYHLPDPIHVLMKHCDIARERILVDTASASDIPESAMIPIKESKTHVMSGVDGLAWLPGGPAAIAEILRYKGFKTIDVLFWRREQEGTPRGRFRIVGSR